MRSRPLRFDFRFDFCFRLCKTLRSVADFFRIFYHEQRGDKGYRQDEGKRDAESREYRKAVERPDGTRDERNKADRRRERREEHCDEYVFEAFEYDGFVRLFCERDAFFERVVEGDVVVREYVNAVRRAARDERNGDDTRDDRKRKARRRHDAARPYRRHEYGDERKQRSVERFKA